MVELGLEKNSKDRLIPPLLTTWKTRAGWTGLCPVSLCVHTWVVFVLFLISPRMEIPQPLPELFQCLTNLTVKPFFFF